MPATTSYPSGPGATATDPARPDGAGQAGGFHAVGRLLAALLILSLLLSSGTLRAAPASSEAEAIHVLNRLGFGPAPGDIDRLMKMGVDAYIDEQLHPERIVLPPALAGRLADLQLVHASQHDLVTQFRENRVSRENGESDKEIRQSWQRQLLDESAMARLLPAVASPRQLEEVMVDFWYNHFNIFIGKGLDHALVANYEREAIRPFVFGRFRDILGATARHPAMLFYLDNWLSSAAGFQPRRQTGPLATASGLNENYARELMELHTLGVDGGYTQKDVGELARIFTGWTFDPRQGNGNSLFVFDPRRHDNDDKFWLGHHIQAGGQAEGERALDILASHPATARNIAFQLAQYFVSDTPPKPLVDKLAGRFIESDGNIRSVLAALFASPEFRDSAARGAKFKSPYRYLISALRAADTTMNDMRPLLGFLRQQGMPLYGCQTPDGYKNTETAWLNPDAMTRRVAFANTMATGKLAGRQIENRIPDADRLLGTLGASISPRSRMLVNQAEPALRVAMILGSPDFMSY